MQFQYINAIMHNNILHLVLAALSEVSGFIFSHGATENTEKAF